MNEANEQSEPTTKSIFKQNMTYVSKRDFTFQINFAFLDPEMKTIQDGKSIRWTITSSHKTYKPLDTDNFQQFYWLQFAVVTALLTVVYLFKPLVCQKSFTIIYSTWLSEQRIEPKFALRPIRWPQALVRPLTECSILWKQFQQQVQSRVNNYKIMYATVQVSQRYLTDDSIKTFE
jgi:hypothetical protein